MSIALSQILECDGITVRFGYIYKSATILELICGYSLVVECDASNVETGFRLPLPAQMCFQKRFLGSFFV